MGLVDPIVNLQKRGRGANLFKRNYKLFLRYLQLKKISLFYASESSRVSLLLIWLQNPSQSIKAMHVEPLWAKSPWWATKAVSNSPL